MDGNKTLYFDVISALKKRKEELGLTYKELAEKAGIPLGTLYKYMQYWTPFPADRLFIVLHAVGLDLAIVCSVTQEKAGRR